MAVDTFSRKKRLPLIEHKSNSSLRKSQNLLLTHYSWIWKGRIADLSESNNWFCFLPISAWHTMNHFTNKNTPANGTFR